MLGSWILTTHPSGAIRGVSATAGSPLCWWRGGEAPHPTQGPETLSDCHVTFFSSFWEWRTLKKKKKIRAIAAHPVCQRSPRLSRRAICTLVSKEGENVQTPCPFCQHFAPLSNRINASPDTTKKRFAWLRPLKDPKLCKRREEKDGY